MPMPTHLLPTTVVGSYPQPDWLINRQMLSKMVPRTRVKELWRVAPEFLEQAQDDATLLAIRDMERAGIDIITDGEMRRESYSNRFATALEGLDNQRPGMIRSRAGTETLVPRVVARLRRTEPVELRDMQFLRSNTAFAAKITLPGPFTMTRQAKNAKRRARPCSTPRGKLASARTHHEGRGANSSEGRMPEACYAAYNLRST